MQMVFQDQEVTKKGVLGEEANFYVAHATIMSQWAI